MTTLRSVRPYAEEDFVPLAVVARLDGDIIIPRAMPALDGLLAYAIAQEHGLPPLDAQGDNPPSIEVPLGRSKCGRYHMASFGLAKQAKASLQHIHRKWPIEVSQALSHEKTKSVDIATGRNKGYRLPIERVHLETDQLWWFAIGHVEEVRNLLSWVTRIGKKRAMGAGKVEQWKVWEVEAWGTGFPVVGPGGHALRPLPLEHPELVEPRAGYGVMTYPYYQQAREEWLALPVDHLREAP